MAESAACRWCQRLDADSDHLTFQCLEWGAARSHLPNYATTWEELDSQIWVDEGEEEKIEGVEEFFRLANWALKTRGNGGVEPVRNERGCGTGTSVRDGSR